MTETTRLSLPLINLGQSQKEVTHNEALLLLDSLLQIIIEKNGMNSPPAEKEIGQCWIVGAQPESDWQYHHNDIAIWTSGGWRFVSPVTGMLVLNKDNQSFITYNIDGWISNKVSTLSNVDNLGIGTSADANNALLVEANGILFSAIDTESGGSGNTKLVINKPASNNKGSFLFQTDFSARAEFGCLGNDDLTVKVTNNGANYHDALKISPAQKGRMSLLSCEKVTATGSSKSNAKQLTRQMNKIIGGGNNSGVKLPAPEPGDVIFIGNGITASGEVIIKIYPHDGGTILTLGDALYHNAYKNNNYICFALTSNYWSCHIGNYPT